MAAVLTIAAAAPAHAQDRGADAQDERKKDDEMIVVTGSRLRQLAIDTPTPVRTVEKEDLDEHGYADLGEALADVPGVDVDYSLSSGQTDTSNSGLSSVELRGAGRSRTLTLIDGHRTVSEASNGIAVNMATLPTFYVERVEISTGGASAVYGSDAIAGVVNVITENNLNGIKARVQGTATNDGAGDSREYSFAAGHKFFDDRLYVMGAVTYQKQDPLQGADRDWALKSVSYSQSTNKLTTPNVSGDIPGGLFLSKYFYNGSGLQSNYVSSVNGYDLRTRDPIVMSRENLSTAFKMRYDFSDTLRLTGSVLYSHIETFGARSSASLEYGDDYGDSGQYTVGRIPLTNPFIPAAIRAAAPASGVTFGRRMDELGPLGARNKRDTLRGWLGLEGKVFGDWEWDLTYGYGRYKQDQVRENGVNYANVHNALNVTTINGEIVCADAAARAAGCVPLNLFGLGSVTPAMADYIRDNAEYVAVNRQDTVSGNLTGSPFALPAGPVQVAIGFELRRDATKSHSDAITDGGLSFWGYIPSYDKSIKSAGLYSEVSVPLLRDTPFFYRLTVDGAFGVTQYDLPNVGTTYSYRVGGQWRPVKGLGFRGTFSRAERAPTITELYAPLRMDTDDVNDLCNGVTATTAGTIAQNCRANPGIAAAIASGGAFHASGADINLPESGNPDLMQETGYTFTAGMVLNPGGIFNGFQASVDYWDIRVKNAIREIEPEDVQFICYSSPAGQASAYCDKITRGADGQLTGILNQVINEEQMRRRGIDFALSYRFNLQSLGIPGRFNLTGSYTHLLELTAQYRTAEGVEVLDGAGEVGDSTDVARASFGWTMPRFSLKWTTAYIGPALDDNSEPAEFAARGITNPLFLHVPSYTRHDISFSLTPSLRNPNLRFYGTVRNLFNKYGPFLPTGTDSGNRNNYSAVYSAVLGRTFTVGAQLKF
ncbi:TonB-dependent receptor [Sphingomonas sp. HITSZ_GF]|uniref:TonB-dependent receptor plug domain-containing protein n=1 Tax=Sphingomonas sp. HITSZ_GF TaxID=3037247 RepID=UPI00240D4437|nr:TonB-dependent receptor [Sphingomonas sp. HITSZ_GF]MDG2535885.1 TonB-dependent receptor [Sphingomonas sp. HITSZ_GF]